MKDKVSERSIRLTIGMMRSMASQKPISPFHLEAAKEMEAMLEELLALRKKLTEMPSGLDGLEGMSKMSKRPLKELK